VVRAPFHKPPVVVAPTDMGWLVTLDPFDARDPVRLDGMRLVLSSLGPMSEGRGIDQIAKVEAKFWLEAMHERHHFIQSGRVHQVTVSATDRRYTGPLARYRRRTLRERLLSHLRLW